MSVALFAGRCRGGLRATRVGVGFLILTGTCEALASLALWAALAEGKVSAVTPLVNAQPMFTVFLAAILLRDVEKVTWRLAMRL
jgi:uncharacterized membrane protein